ncbi:MAG: HAMP domain-containing protein [Pelatocladus maniniholoensis HA4357-MV3]|jgi:methyl-accepting chemotaxis protein PixJ|uniref:HAMP domain-containing protein n=1 Tax=Pelatocladus maniniholoensis HA4357-MV3 TaxID=1117104 RepID=A0A9E3H5W7_9NOST|nr:HAMP domain-containing protein [Pelatocladus maniniholoensis HA4357-MV3]
MVKKIDVEKNSSAKNADFQASKFVVSSETNALIERKKDFQNPCISGVISCIRRLSLRTKVLVFAFTVSTLPVLGVGSLSHYLMNQLVAQKIINTNQDKANYTHTKILLARQRRLLLLLQMGTVVTALLVGGIVAILANRLTQVILAATTAVNELGQGNLNTRIAIEGEDELAVLGSNINHMADQLQDLLQKQTDEAEQLKLLTLERVSLLEATQALKDFAIQLSGILNCEDIYNLAVHDIQKALKTERTIVYKFDNNWLGSVITESVIAGLPSAIGVEIHDSCLQNDLEKYQQGRVMAINNIYQAGLSDCDIEQLELLAVKAYLVAPILLGDQLLGLLIVHQCSQPRLWQQSEIDLCEQFARAVGLALERANLLEQTEKGRKAAEIVSQQQRQQKQRLQLLRLQEDIEGASTGDLTVRAEVTTGEIGTVADFFNSMLESLQKIVTQVKQVAIQVEVDSGIAENSRVPNQLAIEALKQAEQINKTLDFLEQMKVSIQTVAKSANQTATVARTACNGGTTIDLAVENSMSLQQTIEQTTKKIQRLGKYTQEIYCVVASLNKIAMQTNLLAINAGIEAVRPHADEGGQAFAVVTQEVAVLAAQSAAATQEIETVLANIQFEISEVVKAMELGREQVVEETRLVQDTKQNFINIFNACCEIDQLVQSISTVTLSQVQTSEDITELIKEIAKVSEVTNHLSCQLSESLQKTFEISQQLQASVGIFKVG